MGDLIGWLIALALVIIGVAVASAPLERDCPFCQGKGYVGDECHVCDGKGKI